MNKIMTAEQWLSTPKYIHITVMDPDGWRKPGFNWLDEINEPEFVHRLSESTTITRPMKKPLVVYLRLLDAGTDNACWQVCAKDDHGAIPFTPVES